MTGWEGFVFSFFNARVAAEYWPKILLGLGVVALYFLSDLIFNNSQYLDTIHLERKTKNREFKGRNSPLAEPERPAFDSLDYFDPNPDYKFLADLEIFESPETYQMQMTGGAAAAGACELHGAARVLLRTGGQCGGDDIPE